MARYSITHSRKDGFDLDRRLDGFQINGQYYDIDVVIGWILSGAHSFYVFIFGREVAVVVRQHQNGRWYLTTEADTFPPNNLLNLPNC